MTVDYRYSVGREAVLNAGRLVSDLAARGELNPRRKPEDDSWKTDADDKAELLIRRAILGAYTADSFVGEEFEPREGTSGYVWECDPVDYTKGLVEGNNLYTVCLGLRRGDELLFGFVYNPGRDELFEGGVGRGVKRNGHPADLWVPPSISKARVDLQVYGPERVELKRLSSRGVLGGRVDEHGGFSYGLAKVASGVNHVHLAKSGRPGGYKFYDINAGVTLVRARGGVVTAADGGEPDGVTLVTAANPELHEELMALLREIDFHS